MEWGVTLIRAGSYGEGRYPLMERGVTLICAGSYGEGRYPLMEQGVTLVYMCIPDHIYVHT